MRRLDLDPVQLERALLAWAYFASEVQLVQSIHDVIIIGAGPAGLSLACSLSDKPLNVLLLEQADQGVLAEPPEDGREIALTHLSSQLMVESGVWGRLPPDDIAPIERAQVFNGDDAFSMDFERERTGPNALGFLVPNHRIRQAYYEELVQRERVEIRCNCIVQDVQTDEHSARVSLANGQQLEAKLVVAADTRFSTMRRKMGLSSTSRDFSRSAVVCRMSHTQPHQQTAFECFHYGHTIAILPMNGDRSSVVVTVNSRDAGALMALSEDAFNQDIETRLKGILGDMQLLGARHVYPLVAVHANQFVAPRFALIGDAAVGMHPVTAHGFNLGLRGQAILADCVQEALDQQQDIGALSVLQHYEKQHMKVTRVMYHGTNIVVGLFTQDSLPARHLRKVTLHAADKLPPLKRYIRASLTESELNTESRGLPFALLPPIPKLYSAGQLLRRLKHHASRLPLP